MKRKSRYDIVTPLIPFKNPWGIPNVNGLKGRIYYLKLTDKSAITYKKALESIAWYFKREFGYDFVQYTAGVSIDRDVPILFLNSDYIRYECIGGLHLVWHQEINSYILHWVWLHPFIRRSGLLSALWPTLREQYGAFIVDTPLSRAMNSFLIKRKECWYHYKNCPSDCDYLLSASR